MNYKIDKKNTLTLETMVSRDVKDFHNYKTYMGTIGSKDMRDIH